MVTEKSYELLVWKLYLLSDILDGCSIDIEGLSEVKHDRRRNIKRIRKLASDMVCDIDKKCSEYTKNEFGLLSDELNDIIDNVIVKGVEKIKNKR